jgi:2-hydroxychromene-2-carboxylate isomerase
VPAADDELKLYFDYKSPFAYLAMEPALDLPERYAVRVRALPFLLRIKGKGERSVYSEWKVRYSYLDARRWANRRGGLVIKGPPKIYDSRPALIGALFAQQAGGFREYSLAVFRGFFERSLEIDRAEEIGALLEKQGHAPAAWRAFYEGPGPALLERSIDEGHEDHVFGVPIFVFRGELFWGYDRMPLLEERLRACGLAREAAALDGRNA